jgi:filamentous hemagglutinin family protein
MNKYLQQHFWKIRLFMGFIASNLIITLANSVFAQIVPDNTLGKETSVVTPNVNVRGLPATLLEGGATRGVNLFQSFSQFNVGDGQRVYFNNPASIQNILSRITGGDPSKIFGTLGVDGKANLFLLNPNGILFGPNARLDVAGSFLASTANSFVFENGLQFSATNPEAAPLITVNIRPGLQFGGNPSGTISSTANLNAGEDLTLSGIKLDLEGKLEAGKDLTLQATDTIKIRDRVANPFMASAGGKLVLQGNQNVDIFALNNPNSGFFSGGDMLLRSATTIGGDAHYWAGGNFRIEQLDGNLGNLFSPYDPVIRASGDVSFDNYTGASLHILAGGSVNIDGTVNITGADPTNGLSEEVTLSDGKKLQIDGKNQATLDIRAGTTAFGTPGLVPANFPGINSNTPNVINPNPPNLGTIISNQTQTSGANITIGGINNIKQPGGQVFLTNQYQPNSIAEGSVQLTGGILRNINEPTSGSFSIITLGSPVTIDSRGGVLISQGIITGVAEGQGGNINILSRKDVQILKGNNGFGAGLSSVVNGRAINENNRSGNITIVSTNGKIETSGQITTFTSSGTSGDIKLQAKNDIIIANEIASRILNEKQESQGNAGKIGLTSETGDIKLENSLDPALRAIQTSTPKGKGGDITFEAPKGKITVNPGWNIKAESNNGVAGDVTLAADGDIRLGNIEASSNNNDDDNFSQITIQSNQGSVFLDKSRLSTSNSGSKFAGDISITAANTVSILNSNYLDNTPEKDKKGIFSQGKFGRIFIGASNDYASFSPKAVVINNSRLSTTNVVNPQNVPVPNENINAGDISIRATEQISLTDKSRLDTQTARKGDAGYVLLETNNGNISLANTIIFSNVESEVEGNAGNVSIKTNGGNVSLDGKDGITQIQVQTQGNGNAGNVAIATEGGAVSLDNGAIIFSTIEPGGAGNEPGTIDVTAGSLFLKNGAQLQTLVRQANPQNNLPPGNGTAGDITIKVRNTLELDGARTLISSELQQGTVGGKGGNINIDPNLVKITDGARITVDSNGTGDAGQIKLNANRLILDSKGQITGETSSGNGGGIQLNLRDLLLIRRGSLISTTAGQNGSGGNGGNITITSFDNSKPFPFIVGVRGENSDIKANALTGNGGRINISSSGVFGIAPLSREQLAKFNVNNEPGNLLSNDITAISQQGSPTLDGQVNINSPDVDVTDDLVPLPENLVDASKLIAQGCGAFVDKRSEFINAGRGGLPPRPDDFSSIDALWDDTRLTTIPTTQKIPNATITKPAKAASAPIIPAIGWVFNHKGEVTLVSHASGVNSSLFNSDSSSCRIR